MYSVQNYKFDNNPIEITKEEAIEIAKVEDRKVETNEIIDTNAEIRIKKIIFGSLGCLIFYNNMFEKQTKIAQKANKKET